MTTMYEHDTDSAGSWTSEAWADPATVASGPERRTETLTPPVSYAPAPVVSRRRPGIWAAVGILVLALLVGFGATRLVTAATADDKVVGRVTGPSAPAVPGLPSATPTPAPSQGDSGTTDPGQTSPLPGSSQGSQGQPSTGSRSLSSTAAAVAPSVVDITATVGYDGNEAAGTGLVLTADGYVLTNHHVVEGSTALSVTVAMTGKTYQADVVGYDASHDIAVVKLRDASGLTPTPWGDSSTVRVGDAVVGLGNAGGVGGTPIEASGSVTALDQSITASDGNGDAERLSGLIQTDADIKPGDSGGALIDSDGKVIGIITAGSISGSGRSSTTTEGYAVPVNQALRIAEDIRAGRSSATIHIGGNAFLGVSVQGTTSQGVVIASVVTGSAADDAGITAGSVVTSVDGTAVRSGEALRTAISGKKPGDPVTLAWTDGTGAKHTATVKLGTGPVG